MNLRSVPPGSKVLGPQPLEDTLRRHVLLGEHGEDQHVSWSPFDADLGVPELAPSRYPACSATLMLRSLSESQRISTRQAPKCSKAKPVMARTASVTYRLKGCPLEFFV